jgi:hypothetical protein
MTAEQKRIVKLEEQIKGLFAVVNQYEENKKQLEIKLTEAFKKVTGGSGVTDKFHVEQVKYYSILGEKPSFETYMELNLDADLLRGGPKEILQKVRKVAKVELEPKYVQRLYQMEELIETEIRKKGKAIVKSVFGWYKKGYEPQALTCLSIFETKEKFKEIIDEYSETKNLVKEHGERRDYVKKKYKKKYNKRSYNKNWKSKN